MRRLLILNTWFMLFLFIYGRALISSDRHQRGSLAVNLNIQSKHLHDVTVNINRVVNMRTRQGIWIPSKEKIVSI